MWLTHVASMLQSSMTICHTIEREGRPVVVHCSDGWDRTPQLVATSLLCLDPYYRTIEGFQVLVEREWLSFGHKFADRIGHGPGSDETNERCPVFLQWLDCVHQILKQFPCCFEFSMGYLVSLKLNVRESQRNEIVFLAFFTGQTGSARILLHVWHISLQHLQRTNRKFRL